MTAAEPAAAAALPPVRSRYSCMQERRARARLINCKGLCAWGAQGVHTPMAPVLDIAKVHRPGCAARMVTSGAGAPPACASALLSPANLQLHMVRLAHGRQVPTLARSTAGGGPARSSSGGSDS